MRSEFIERWQATLEEKASIEAEAKAAALEAAMADLETHALERAANKEAKMGRNREQEQVRIPRENKKTMQLRSGFEGAARLKARADNRAD